MISRAKRRTPRGLAAAMALPAAALLALAVARPAHACSCRAPKPPVRAMADADAVFLGEAVSMTPALHGKVRYGFAVLRRWKGAPAAQVEIVTHSQSASCGRTFQMGRSYLVFAREEGDVWVDGLCSRTRPLIRALLDVEALDRATHAVPPPDRAANLPPDAQAPDRQLEPPRIRVQPEPPPATPSKRGCAIGDDPPPALGLLALLWLRRRRIHACVS